MLKKLGKMSSFDPDLIGLKNAMAFGEKIFP
jgi:hypothetical protein